MPVHKLGASPDTLDEDVLIDLREYFIIIKSHLIAIISFSLVFSLLCILIVFSIEPVYRSEVTLLIEADEAKIVSIDEVYNLGMGNNEYYFTQFEILKSRDLARQVVEQVGLVDHPLYAQAERGMLSSISSWLSEGQYKDEEKRIQEVVDAFQDSLLVMPIRNTQLVKIGFESSDAQLATDIANLLAKVYIESNLEARLAMTQQAANWLSGRIDGLKSKLEISEKKLQAYLEAEDLVEIEGVKSLVAKELNETTIKLVEARRARTEAENIVMQARNLSSQSIEELATLPAVLQHSLVQRFKEMEADAETRLEELSKRYGYKHPKIIAAKSDVAVARTNLAKQIRKVIKGVHKEYEVAKATEATLLKEVASLKSQIQTITKKEFRLNELNREVMVDRQLYDTFFSRIKETAEAGSIEAAHARVVDPAIVPTKPVKPKRVLLSVLAVLFSVILGVLLAIVREALDRTIKTKDDVLMKLHTQLLGVLPLINKDKQKEGDPSLYFSRNNTSAFSESIRTIRTGVVLSGLDNPHKVLVVTSSVPGEGKTTVSSNLAAAFGQVGKTLLIDGDMRRPSVASNFGIKLTAPGLSNLVAETSEPRVCIHRVEELNIDVIPAGMIPPNPLELLSSRRFAAVLTGLEKHYDRIIIDTAPSEVVSDAHILSTYANALIYVVRADSTNIKVVKSGLARLREAGAPLTGVVLNQVNVDKRQAYGYGKNYYGGYYDYYGYSGTDNPKT